MDMTMSSATPSRVEVIEVADSNLKCNTLGFNE